MRGALGRLLPDLQRQFRVDVPTIIAGAVRKLGVATLRTPHVMNRLHRMVGAALALAGLAMFLDRKHDDDSCAIVALAYNSKRKGRRVLPAARGSVQ